MFKRVYYCVYNKIYRAAYNDSNQIDEYIQ